MAVQLQHVLAGVGVRRRKEQRQAGIERLALRVEKAREGGAARRGQLPAQEDAELGTFGPEMRTMPMPPRPGGVAAATMVSVRVMSRSRRAPGNKANAAALSRHAPLGYAPPYRRFERARRARSAWACESGGAMSAYELAQLNIGVIRGPMDSPVMAQFAANLERVNALADASPGFVWRLQTEAGDATAHPPVRQREHAAQHVGVARCRVAARVRLPSAATSRSCAAAANGSSA